MSSGGCQIPEVRHVGFEASWEMIGGLYETLWVVAVVCCFSLASLDLSCFHLMDAKMTGSRVCGFSGFRGDLYIPHGFCLFRSLV